MITAPTHLHRFFRIVQTIGNYVQKRRCITLNLQLVGIAKQMHQRLRIIRFKIRLSDVSQDHHTRFQLCLRSHCQKAE